jgi:hypothetical protein
VRRGLGRGRTLIALGSVLAILAIPLPWLQAGGTILEAAAWTGVGGGGPILALFGASVGSLVVMLIPFTTRSGAFWLDRGATYVLLLLVAAAGLSVEVVELLGTEGRVSLAPLDAPGLWLAVGGVALMVWGALEILADRAREDRF